MVLVNYTTRELTAKLVYYGPGLCGKTTNLQYIFDNLLPKDRRGKMVELKTETDRTLFFDFLPLELGTIRGLKTRLQLYTVPGQAHYNATRKIVLKGADGIVFVADSQPHVKESNLESYLNMKANLAEHGLDLRHIPFVLQFNKRDLPNAMSMEQMEGDLNEYNVPFWEAIAIQGIGVEDTLKSLVKLVMKNLAGRFQQEGAIPAAVGAPAVIAVPVAMPAPPPAPPAPLFHAVEALPLEAEPLDASPFGMPAAPEPMEAGGLDPFVLPQPIPPPAMLPTFSPPAMQPAFPPAAKLPHFPPPPAAPPLEAPPEPAAGDALELELDVDENTGDEVLDLDDSSLVAEPAVSAGETVVDLESAMLSGDTMMSAAPLPLMEPPSRLMPPAPAPLPPMAPPSMEPEVEAALLSGDTVMGDWPLAEGAEPGAPVFGYAAGGSLDLESALLAAPAEAPAPALAPPPRAPAPPPAKAPAPAAEAAVLEIGMPVQLGHVVPGSVVERVVRIPVEYHDGAVTRRVTLSVRLELKID
jgi:signal recognition particle receptor subunit beta